MSVMVYNYMSRCDCGSIFLPSSRGICPPCYRIARKVVFDRRSKSREARRQATFNRKAKSREARRQDKAVELANRNYFVYEGNE